VRFALARVRFRPKADSRLPCFVPRGMKGAAALPGGKMSVLIMLAALVGPDSQAATSTNQPVSSAMAAAIANKPRAKTAPSLIREPDDLRPAAAMSAGEFGEVTLSGIIGEDGKFQEAKIGVSSRSTAIDAAALAAVPTMLFEPARDADGKPLSVPANLPLEYSQTDFHGPRGLAHYQCGQFVRDYDWWYRTWPAEKQDRVFKTLRGFVVLADLKSGKTSGDFASEWKRAIESCRKSPDKLMLDMLKPHGSFIRAMVKE
jgi:TonB family protein